MTLKDSGREKRKKQLKCDSCRQRFNITDEDIIKLGDFKYIECPFCGTQQILKK